MKRTLLKLADVLARLRSEGLITDATAISLEQAAPTAGDRGTPWYVRAMVAISAWIAALLFMGFVYGTRLVTSSESMAVAGTIICTGSIVLQRNGKQVLFLSSLALAFCFTGQIMLIAGLGSMIHSVVTVSFLIMLLNLGFLAVYDDRTMRFLSTMVIISAAFAIIMDKHLPYGSQVMILLLAGGSAALWMSEPLLAAGRMAPFYRPVGYGLVVGLFGCLLPWVMPVADVRHLFAPSGSWIVAGGLLATLLAIEYRLLLEHELLNDRTGAVVLIGTLALFYPARRMPGMLAAIMVVLLGFRRGNRILIGFALAFLFVFISAYYYHLGMTLMQKSISLMLTGLVLLGLRFALVKLLGREEEVSHE